jgi:hypothetical protein
VVNTARNSLNHSIRFNSVAIERVPSSDLNNNNNNNNNSLSFTKSIKDVAQFNKQLNVRDSPGRNNNQRNPRNNNKNGKRNNNNKNSNNSLRINQSSPWFNQLAAFQDCLSHAVDLNESVNHLFFWESIRKAMDLYHELKGTPDFDQSYVSFLVHGLHTSLRANRVQLTRLAKKPDNDSKSFHNDMQTFISSSLNEIIEDLLNQTVAINEDGAMHLLTSLKELKQETSAVQLWSSAIQNDSLSTVFVQQKVVGVLLPMLFQNGTEFADIEKLYEQSKATKNYIHPFLLSGIIKTALAADEYQTALNYFEELCSLDTGRTLSSLTEVHLAFIRDSKNIEIATKFFEKAINNETPYKLTLQVNSVKQFLENIWLVDRDFSKVLDVWVKTTNFYGRNINHGISSSLNTTFFEIFFQNFASDKEQGLAELKDIISTYNGIKPIDEPFFNIIISRCVIWEDKEVIDSIYDAYKLYNLSKSAISRRVYLKSLGSINVTDEEIISAWLDLIKHNDSEGYTYIANADWAALRDATVNSIYLHKNFEGSSSEILPKDELYCQIVDKFQPFCRDNTQFVRLKNIVKVIPRLTQILPVKNKLDLEMPEFQHLYAKTDSFQFF